MKATIVTYHATPSAARAIEDSLRPDNAAAPKPLSIGSKATGTRLTSAITGAQDIESLLATADDLLLCLMPADRVLTTINRKKVKSSS